MGKIQTPNRIREEDFKEDIRDTIGKLASGINSFQDDVTAVINGRIDFDNINRQKAQFDVLTDSSGVPINLPQIKLSLGSKPYGINIVKMDNLLAPGAYPAAMPFLGFTFNATILTVTALNGLGNGTKYRVYIEIIGS